MAAVTNVSAAAIVQLGAAVLRVPAAEVTDWQSDDTRKDIAVMRASLAETQGVGLAAPQIGISKRIIIVASRPTARYPNAPLMSPTVMLNPSYQPRSENKEKGWEGCLSVPSIRALVPRYLDIDIRYYSEQGELVTANLHGFVARVFQHEYDHLEGMVYLDRVEDNRDIVAESEYFRQQM